MSFQKFQHYLRNIESNRATYEKVELQSRIRSGGVIVFRFVLAVAHQIEGGQIHVLVELNRPRDPTPGVEYVRCGETIYKRNQREICKMTYKKNSKLPI